AELQALRVSEGKLKQQQLEATRRENILKMKLVLKDQEIRQLQERLQEMKRREIITNGLCGPTLVDPAISALFERLRAELDSTKKRLEETQNELSAWKFTPDSNTGKRLMAKCRLLYQENEELGKMI